MDCEATLTAAGVPCSRYLSVAEAISDPQIVERQSMSAAEDGAGRFLVPHAPFRFGDGSVSVQPRVPALGEHTRDVLATILGMGTAAIDSLTQRSIVTTSPGS